MNTRTLEARLLRAFNARVSEQHSTVVMASVAAAFEVSSLLRPIELVVSATAPTTAMPVGPVIFLPRTALTDEERLDHVLHGLGHVAQYWDNPVGYARAYRESPLRRSTFEREAERGRLEALWLLQGALPRNTGSLHAHGYCVEAHDPNEGDALGEAIRAEGVVTRVGRAVAEVCMGRATDDAIGEVARMVMAWRPHPPSPSPCQERG